MSGSRITFEITSEIYSETDFSSSKLSDGKVLSKFNFTYPRDDDDVTKQKYDEDGDLIISRRKKEFIEIEHSQSTVLKLVGLQIWRGALLLSDFIIALEKTLFRNKNILELGAGVGLTSIIAGIYAKNVVCTDLDVGGILKLIDNNFERNKNVIKCKNMKVMELDFMAPEWSNELLNVIKEADIILAADVIYDDDLTDAFILSLEKILLHPLSTKRKSIYIALEKRYVFTVCEMETCAPCYEYFLHKFQQLKEKHYEWKIQSIPLDFPQYFEYERSKSLVLWKITN